jgi:hypothetical protein
MVVYRSHVATSGPSLAWKVFEICDLHLQRLYDLDDRARSGAAMSEIPPPSVRGAVR